jgi:cobaltochelatase CobS
MIRPKNIPRKVKSVSEIEALLGPADKFIPAIWHMRNLSDWAWSKGLLMPGAKPTLVELTNLYHDHGPNATDSSDLDALEAALDAMQPSPPVPAIVPPTPSPGQQDTSAFARLVRHVELTGYAPFDPKHVEKAAMALLPSIEAQIGEAVQKLVPPPAVIDIRTPDGIERLEGRHHSATPEIIKIVSLGDPVMMVGPAGAGKTTIGKTVAEAMRLPFRITSTVFDTHELLGFVDGHGNYHSTPFRKAFELGGVWVADEIDAWDAAALLAANSALANGYITFPDQQEPTNAHADFRMIACANTFGTGADRVYVGRNQLDAASLDRFAMVEIDYDRQLEIALAPNVDWCREVWKVRDIVNKKNIRHVVSTRAIIKGGKAIQAGMDWDRVREIYLFKGISEADREKVLDNM